MSGKVIFSLTACQATALLALQLGERIHADTQGARDRMVDVLRRKGLVIADLAGQVKLTDFGVSAVTLCARLAIEQHTKGGR